jgi:hypothetical protein
MLESELKRLNENIEYLNRLLETMADTAKRDAKPAQIKAHEPKREVHVTEAPSLENEQSSGYSTDDIKAMALAISRKDRSKQASIKEKLAEHNAKIATDLTGDDLQVVGAWLEALKNEVGA